MNSAWRSAALAALLGCLAATGCQPRSNSAATAPGAAGAEAKMPADTVSSRQPIVVSVAAVKRQPVQRRVSAVGTLWGFERITLTPKVEGRVQVVHFEVGDRVQPGAVVLEIDDTDYKLAVDEAQRALETELAKLALEKPPGPGFEPDALPGVVQAKLQLENSRKRFDRQRLLSDKNAGSQELLEQSEMEFNVAQALLLRAQLEVRTTVAEVKHRQAVLAVAQQKLTETRVIAPQLKSQSPGNAGTPNYVVSQRMVSAGEMVRAFPSTPVYELVYDSVLKLKATVPERYAGELRVGQPVEVRVDAFPGQVFAATVARVNPTIDPESRTLEIEAHVPNADHPLKSGGFAKADVLTHVDANAVTVPTESIVTFAGVNKVFLVRDDKAQEVLIDIQSRGDGWVEIRGDLAAGDSIVTSGQSQLAQGTPVAVRAAASVSQRNLPVTPRP